MKLEECRKLEKGTTVRVSLGDGWYQEGIFNGLVLVTKFGNMTFSEMLKSDFSLNKGRKVWEARVELPDEKGKAHTCYINPRRLRKENK